jgi:tetratricopeptide (TPR) repeat protein
MKHVVRVCLLLSVCTVSVRAEGPTLKDARQRWLHGNYEEARVLYETLKKDPQQASAAVLGLSWVLESKGEYTQALATIEAAFNSKARSTDLVARRAELMYTLGRWDEALKSAEAAIGENPNHFLARWVRAQVYSDRGETKKADGEYRWFVRTYTERSNADKDIKDPEELLLVGLAGCENARWNKLPDQFTFILNEVYGDAVKYDKDFWPAEYQAGMLLLEKYNRGAALDAFDKALKINPNAAEALVGKGLAALQKLDVKEAEQFAERALKINPNLPEALRLRADVDLTVGSLGEAIKELEHARQINPRREATLGRLAASFFLQHKQDAFDALIREVTLHDPKAGTFYHELAERLDDRRHFSEAEKYYLKAAELRPELPGPRSALGLLYMRMGREAEARKILDEAFKADPFNVRVSNNLKVLRHLDAYQTLKTEHFELRYDPKKDGVLAHYMAGYLEQTYASLATKFNYQPKGPILLEVFNNHEMFSGRVISLPDLHTIGACSGRMVAMVSPHGKGLGRAYNWARVLRHELVHIFNLEQTNFQVPHWFTEGLAVGNEGFPRPPLWTQLLIERVRSNQLKTLDDIDMGFMRPSSQVEWNLAYCQSQLYVDYLKKQYRPASIAAFLAAYRDGLDTAAVIQKVCRVDVPTFEKGYRAFLDEIVRGINGKPVEKVLTFRELKAAHEKNPADVDLAARLAEQHLRRRERAEARQLADAVLAKQKNHPLASWVKASLLQAAGEENEALALLEAAVDERAPEPHVVGELAKMYFNAKDPVKAAHFYELGCRAEPYEKKWLEGLARVYAEAGQHDKQIGVLKDLVPLDADDLDNRRRLAQLLIESGQDALAEQYARQALEIDVLDQSAQDVLIRALVAQKKEDEARRLRQLFTQGG